METSLQLITKMRSPRQLKTKASQTGMHQQRGLIPMVKMRPPKKPQSQLQQMLKLSSKSSNSKEVRKRRKRMLLLLPLLSKMVKFKAVLLRR